MQENILLFHSKRHSFTFILHAAKAASNPFHCIVRVIHQRILNLPMAKDLNGTRFVPVLEPSHVCRVPSCYQTLTKVPVSHYVVPCSVFHATSKSSAFPCCCRCCINLRPSGPSASLLSNPPPSPSTPPCTAPAPWISLPPLLSQACSTNIHTMTCNRHIKHRLPQLVPGPLQIQPLLKTNKKKTPRT